jgi:signal transduction histidine kinase
MRSLQYRIAAILIVAIVLVVLVATAVTAAVVASGDASRMVGPMAQHIAFTADMMASGEAVGVRNGRAHERVEPAPAAGVARSDLAAALSRELADQGVDGVTQVTEDPATGTLVASYGLPEGRWLVIDFPRPLALPPGLWAALAAWLLIVVVGVAGVALVMARRVTQPFGMLETAVTSVGPDGVLPHVPETGSSEVRHTAMALNALSDRLKSSMDSRMRLVAAAGHDLRTPMTRMRLRAEFLSEDERASWLADLDELELIADSAIRLVREEGAGADQASVPLHTLLAETVADLAAAQLPAQVVASTEAIVKAGPLALKRALRNLLINAATHGGGARASLSRGAGKAYLVIDDDGPGIPPSLMAQVFEPFFTSEPGRSRSVKGAGLGLAIAREIVERFGGSIAIENRPEGGLRQTVTLRLA